MKPAPPVIMIVFIYIFFSFFVDYFHAEYYFSHAERLFNLLPTQNIIFPTQKDYLIFYPRRILFFPRRNRRNNGTMFMHSIYMSACNLYFRVFPVYSMNIGGTRQSQNKLISAHDLHDVYFMNIGGTRQSQNKFCFALVCTMFLCGIVFFELSCAEIILPRYEIISWRCTLRS